MGHFDLHALGRLARRAVRGWIEDAAPSMGAALAFYAMLSLAPLLLVAVALVYNNTTRTTSYPNYW